MLTGRAEGELLVILAYAVIAGVNTMPKPGANKTTTQTKWEVGYSWLYDWTHVLLNSPMATRFEQHYNVTPNGTTVSETKTVSSGTATPEPNPPLAGGDATK